VENNNPIPDDQVRWGSFNTLIEDNLGRLKLICEEDTGLVGQLYKKSLNIPDAVSPEIYNILNSIDKISNMKDYWSVAGSLLPMGVSALFHMFKNNDDKNPDYNIPHIVQSGLGLPDKSY